MRFCVLADGVSGGEGEEDGEGSTLAGLAPAHEDAAHMVLLHDAFGECEAEAPAALLGGVAGVEHRLLVFAGYAFACVGDCITFLRFFAFFWFLRACLKWPLKNTEKLQTK